MSTFSKASLIQARNEIAVATPTAVQSLRLKPTIIASASGWRGSYSNTTSTLPYSTGFSTRVSSTASFATPSSYYTNHSSSSLASPSSTHILLDLYPTATLAPTLSSPTSGLTLSTGSAAPPSETDQEMSLETKVGLAMIPIAVGLCAWGLVLLILWRRRKTHQSHHRITSFTAFGPEKANSPLLPSPSSSLSSSTRSRRIFTMAAFYSRDNKQGMSVMRPTTPPPFNSPVERAKTDSNPDSPIDGGSPFRLRPGEARKSLGSEISELWPSPPPTAWARRLDILEQLPESRFGRDMTGPRLKRSENRKSLRDARDVTRPSMGDDWPLI